MATKKITLNELKGLVRHTIREEVMMESFFEKNSLIHLIFSEDEIRELFNLVGEAGNQHMRNLELDPYSDYDSTNEIGDYIINTMNKKNIKLEKYELYFLIKLVKDKILL